MMDIYIKSHTLCLYSVSENSRILAIYNHCPNSFLPQTLHIVLAKHGLNCPAGEDSLPELTHVI